MVYQDAAAFVAGPAALTPAASTGHPPVTPGTSFYLRGYSGGAQTAWLERTLAAGRRDEGVDWIIVQMHQCAASSSVTGNGSDLGIRQAADAVEDAVWSARRDTFTGYGITVFDVEPASSEAGGQASIKVTHYHAVGADPVNPATGAKGAPTPDYTEFETFRLVRSRS